MSDETSVPFSQPGQWLEGSEIHSVPSPFPELVSGGQIQKVCLPLPPEMMVGLLCRGEKGELAGGSKSFKTWALIHQALAIASGTQWWNFEAKINEVIFLNLEIPPPFFEQRVRIVSRAMGIETPKNFYVWHLRHAKLGDPLRWSQFLEQLKVKCTSIHNPFLTSDPIYKLLGGRNENSAGDVAKLLEQLDEMVETTDGANFFGHHFAKGNAGTKEVIDRASGSGVFQRDPDSILMMTPHQNEGAFTVDTILRNHAPVEPFVVQWDYPIFKRVDLDPGELKKPKSFEKIYSVEVIAKHLGTDCLSTKALRTRLMEETGMSKATFFRLLKEAEEQNFIAHSHIDKTWERISRSY